MTCIAFLLPKNNAHKIICTEVFPCITAAKLYSSITEKVKLIKNVICFVKKTKPLLLSAYIVASSCLNSRQRNQVALLLQVT